MLPVPQQYAVFLSSFMSPRFQDLEACRVQCDTNGISQVRLVCTFLKSGRGIVLSIPSSVIFSQF